MIAFASTSCPGTKCRAVIAVPIGRTASWLTLNSRTWALYGTPAFSNSVFCEEMTRFQFFWPQPRSILAFPFLSKCGWIFMTWRLSIFFGNFWNFLGVLDVFGFFLILKNLFTLTTVQAWNTPRLSQIEILPVLTAINPVRILFLVHKDIYLKNFHNLF